MGQVRPPRNTAAADGPSSHVSQAITCFKRSLEIKESGVALRSISMLLRQLPGTAVEKGNNITESLEVAKQAVKLGVGDGKSWFVLGNAYLALFFAKMETVEHVKQVSLSPSA